ncbi:MAG: patatin-like phospholipase family protein [Bacteroidota bacterium]|nr:patatin-like phospholipase family protein [Bacteroidota bacterium]
MKKDVSLVLSGGGARGTAHIGVIEELEKQGYNIHSITGTSMGALVGGIYAVGKLKEFKNWITSLDKIDVFKLLDFTLGKQGFIKGDKVFESLKEFIPDFKIEDIEINYSATATDLTNKKEILFTKGSIYDAIRASIAIPNVLTPFKFKESILVDGGVVNNIPINSAKRIKNDILIAVNVNANVPLVKVKDKSDNYKDEEQKLYQKTLKKIQKQFNRKFSHKDKDGLNSFDIMNESFEMMREKLVVLALEKNPPDILIEISGESCSVYNFYEAKKLIEIGQKATVKSLKNAKKP